MSLMKRLIHARRGVISQSHTEAAGVAFNPRAQGRDPSKTSAAVSSSFNPRAQGRDVASAARRARHRLIHARRGVILETSATDARHACTPPL